MEVLGILFHPAQFQHHLELNLYPYQIIIKLFLLQVIWKFENIYTYDWDPSTSSWSQRSGSPLSVGSGSAYGDSLSLTKDGDILVVGSDGGDNVT